MLIRINGWVIEPVKKAFEDGVDITYDLQDTLVDAYHIVHTPINLDISYAGHNIISGDVNTFNIATNAVSHIAHGVNILLDSLF